jgi:hypothetical protein
MKIGHCSTAHFPARKVQPAPSRCGPLPENARKIASPGVFRGPQKKRRFAQKISGRSGSPNISRYRAIA